MEEIRGIGGDRVRKDIRELAQRLGLTLETWAPGDGATRYQFLNTEGWSLGIAVGARMARAFLQGYAAGVEAGEKGARLIGVNR
jgi:hypothetical protein